jgi:small subunit ribosomal protein S20
VANTASAKQRIRNSARKAKFNQLHRSRARTAVKATRVALAARDVEGATEAEKLSASKLDKAAGKGLIKSNAAARVKSRAQKKLNAAAK